jgi:DNA-binding transcriptional LysR family regulator
VKLTPEGRLLLELIQPHVSGLDSLAHLFATRRGDLPQQVTVASTHYLLSYHLPPAVRAFTSAESRARLQVRACLWPDVLQLVEQGHADLGIVPYNPEEPRNPHLDYEPLFNMELMLLAPADHPLTSQKRIAPADLVRYPLILGPPEGFDRKVLERLLHKHDLMEQMHVIMESHSLDVNRKYVALGVGITVAHAGRDLKQHMPDLHVRPLDLGLAGLPVAIVVRKGSHLSGPVEEFRRTLRRFLSPLAAAKQK